MNRILFFMASLLGCLFFTGCASQMESANTGANRTGQVVGGAMRIPNSFTEGVASGVAGQPSPNPYNR